MTREVIIYQGTVAATGAATDSKRVYECPNNIISTILWVKVTNSSVSAYTFSLFTVRKGDTVTLDQAHSVIYSKSVAAGGEIAEKVWVPLNEGDRVYCSTSASADVTAFIAGFNRRSQ